MTKATLTYIGGETDGGAKSTTWRGVSFPLKEPVEVTDDVLIRKAKGHPHFTVAEHADKEPDADDKAAGKGKKAKADKKAADEGDKEPDADDKAA
jgi:hypothetical protein